MLNADLARPAHVDFYQEHLIAYECVVLRYRLALPLMNLIGWYVDRKKRRHRARHNRKPERNFWLVDGISINSRRMKDGAARWPALNTCYNFRAGQGQTLSARRIDSWWMNIRNAQAVRNRLKIAKCELHKAIEASAKPGQPVRILSLAAGTAQGVIEVAAECNKVGVETAITLMDTDPSALRYASELAQSYGLEITTIEGDVLSFARYIGNFKADIVEMMGLIDYLSDTIVKGLIRRVHRYLDAGGYFFTCHVHPNGEAYFLEHVVDWCMLYRTFSELQNLVAAGGFSDVTLITEPHGIHSVAVAQKIE